MLGAWIPSPRAPFSAQSRAGGTKFVCAVAEENGAILAERRLPTRDPDSTLTAVCSYFHEQFAHLGAPARSASAHSGPCASISRALCMDASCNTPKAGWSGTDIVGRLTRGICLSSRIRHRCQRRGAGGTSLGEQRAMWTTWCMSRSARVSAVESWCAARRCTGSCIPESGIYFHAATPWMLISRASARSMAIASKVWPRDPRSWLAAAPSCTPGRR